MARIHITGALVLGLLVPAAAAICAPTSEAPSAPDLTLQDTGKQDEKKKGDEPEEKKSDKITYWVIDAAGKG